MSQYKINKPQTVKQQRSAYDVGLQKHTHKLSKEEQEDKSGAIERSATKLCPAGNSYFYAHSGKKPQLLLHMERYLDKELQLLNADEPNFQELKLQVYRDVFALFIKDFKSYQPILSDIKREYETTIAYQRNIIQDLEPLQSHLRLVTEECNHKIHARWAQEHCEMAAIKMDKEQLRRELEALKEREKATHAVVEHLQSEVSQQYLLYREERDARKLLIRQLNDLKGRSLTEEHTGEVKMGRSGSILEQIGYEAGEAELSSHLELIASCQEESDRMLAESGNVTPQCGPATLEQTLKQTALQFETLQSDYNQLKSKYDALVALHQNRSMKNTGLDAKIIQMAVRHDGVTIAEKSSPPSNS